MLKNLKNQYENEQLPVSRNLWENLEKELAANHQQSNHPIRKNKTKTYWWAAASLFAILTSLLYWNSSNSITIVPIVKTKIEKQPQPIVEHKEAIAIHKEEEETTASPTKKQYKEETTAILKISYQPAKTEFSNPISNYEQSSTLKEQDQIIPPAPPIASKTKYISSQDLLFGLELDKTRKDQQNSQKSKLGMTDIHIRKNTVEMDDKVIPKSLKILGITIYNNDSIKNN